MTDILRKKLAKRARQAISLASGITPKELIKSPSQKRSESIRKKDMKRAGIKEVLVKVPSDCRDCKKSCTFSYDLNLCPERSMVVRCQQCGQKIRIRIIPGVAWERCPICEVKR